LIACEPADLGGEDGKMGLSEAVAAAVMPAVEQISCLLVDLTASSLAA
jgi:hypothetical protein